MQHSNTAEFSLLSMPNSANLMRTLLPLSSPPTTLYTLPTPTEALFHLLPMPTLMENILKQLPSPFYKHSLKHWLNLWRAERAPCLTMWKNSNKIDKKSGSNALLLRLTPSPPRALFKSNFLTPPISLKYIPTVGLTTSQPHNFLIKILLQSLVKLDALLKEMPGLLQDLLK